MKNNTILLNPAEKIQEALDFPEMNEDIFHYLLKKGFFVQKGGKCLLSFFLLNFINLKGITLEEKKIINTAFEYYGLKLPYLDPRKQFSVLLQAKRAANEMFENKRSYAVYSFLEIWSRLKKNPTSTNKSLANSIRWLTEKMVKEFEGTKNGIQVSVTKFLYALLISHLAD